MNRSSDIRKKGRDYYLTINNVLSSYIFPARFGLLLGGLLLSPIIIYWIAYFYGVELPSSEFVDILILIMTITGICILGKRNIIRIYQKEAVLEDWGRVFWHTRSKRETLDKFDRILIKHWQLPGFESKSGNLNRPPVPGVIYLVQLGGSGLRTINFYNKYSDARDLAMTIAEITQLPVREVL